MKSNHTAFPQASMKSSLLEKELKFQADLISDEMVDKLLLTELQIEGVIFISTLRILIILQ